MARPFEFSADAKFKARLRQQGKCACCGQGLRDAIEHAHHVVPNQSGIPGNPKHAWLATSDNCVVLCDACHGRVHQDGKFRAGAVAPASYFAFSHGPNKPLHQVWVNQMNARTRAIWP
jgi:hypothetical protein